ncbi:MAG TPA: SAM-dependent methyltransferase, partial [Verrucomicrobiae bacterium]|nr:SAM-dependent methyltransferase [Verrucomicrobiae bacterium]
LLELCLDYDDQYSLLVAKPTLAPTEPTLPIEADLARLQVEVKAFPDRVAKVQNHWRSTIEAAHRQGKRIVLWGGGSKAVSFLTTLGITDQVGCVVDINPFKHGKFIPGAGHPVVGPESLQEYRPDLVILMNPIYTNEIRTQLNQMGLAPQILPV